MPNTWEFNNVVLEPPDERARMLAEEVTNSRFPELSYNLSKLANLYRFLDVHRNDSPLNLSKKITENGQPIFSPAELSEIMKVVKSRHNSVPNMSNLTSKRQHGGEQPPIKFRDPADPEYDPKNDMFGAPHRPGFEEAPHQVEFWDKLFNSFYKAYEKSPIYVHFSKKWDGVWWYLYLMYNLEQMDMFGPYISMALDTYTTNIPAISEGLEAALHYVFGLLGGIATVGLGLGPAAELGSLVGDVIAAVMATTGAIVSLSRKRTGDAFKLILVAIPFDIGATLNMAANAIEKQYERYLVNRARIIETFRPVPKIYRFMDYYVPEVGVDKGPPPPTPTIEEIKKDVFDAALEKTGANKALAKLNAIQADPFGAVTQATGANKTLAKLNAIKADPFGAATRATGANKTLAKLNAIKADPFGAATQATGVNKRLAKAQNSLTKATTLPPLPNMPKMPTVANARKSFTPTMIRKRGGTRRKTLKKRKGRYTRR